jgi:hypothetical protein
MKVKDKFQNLSEVKNALSVNDLMSLSIWKNTGIYL